MIDIVLIIIGIILIVMLATSFGISDEPSGCPRCGMGTLTRLYRGDVRTGPRYYKCSKCPATLRLADDGVLVDVDPTL